MARLVYTDRAGRQMVHQLDPQRGQTVVGRHPDCDIVIADASVSRRHCAVAYDDGGFRIADLGSANGTLVNDVLVSRRHLANHDVVRCGTYVLQFFEDPAPAPAGQAFRDAPIMETQVARLPVPARPADVDPAEYARLKAFNEQQAEALGRIQDALAEAEAARAAAARPPAEARAEPDALARRLEAAPAVPRPTADATLALGAAEPDDAPRVTITRDNGSTLPEADAAAMASRAARLIEENDHLRRRIEALQTAVPAVAAAPAEGPGEVPEELTSLRRQVDRLRRELDATRAGQMATDAERLARAAWLENELRATEAREAAAERRLEQVEQESAEAAAWLRAAGVRLAELVDVQSRLAGAEARAQAHRDEAKGLRSALDEARAAAHQTSAIRRQLRAAQARLEALGEPLPGPDAALSAVDTAAEARARDAEAALLAMEQRAHAAEDALRRVREAQETTEAMDPETAERIQGMQAQLGAVTRRAMLMKAKDLELERRQAQIAALEDQVRVARDERDAVEQRMLELIVTQQQGGAGEAEASVRSAVRAVLGAWFGLLDAEPDEVEAARARVGAALEALDAATGGGEADEPTLPPESLDA
ncbi:MAG: FHA domain-containing protein [Myxococcales bacterium]|nr:FHA domain-containing protein [Myxococcales bacterium]